MTSYTEAVRTVDPWKAVGKPSSLWTAFARFYEAHGDVANARAVFERASQADFRAVDDLSAVWCEWAEFEIRAGKWAEALSLMQRATAEPSGKRLHRSGKRSRSYSRRGRHSMENVLPGPCTPCVESLPGAGDVAPDRAAQSAAVRAKLHRNLRVWSLLLDLEESLSSVASAKAAYDRVISLKVSLAAGLAPPTQEPTPLLPPPQVATPLMVLNYAAYLEERSFFEDAFRAFERGVMVRLRPRPLAGCFALPVRLALQAFPWPHVKELWVAYLSKFVERYGGSKLERARDLFEQVC